MVLAEIRDEIEDAGRLEGGGISVMKVREHKKHDTGMDCKRHDYLWNESIFVLKRAVLGTFRDGSIPHLSIEQTALSPT